MSLRQRRFVLAIDYGTTYTGVAYATPESNKLPFEEIDLVEYWGPNMGNHQKIPSVVSFSRSTIKEEHQWGCDLSPDAVAMVHTKLELEPQSVTSELDLLLESLDGMKNLNFDRLKDIGPSPPYTTKSAEQIVTEYLLRVFTYLSKNIEILKSSKNNESLARYKDRVPVDIVITIPTDWTYTAKNATYRAVMNAGFNDRYFPQLTDVLFVTESEAAALYTARYLKEERDEEFLTEGQCFVLCDAGGGTVDVVSYKVKQVDPSLELERVCIPTSNRYGSTKIDAAFKKWLRGLIGDSNYRKLDDNQDFEKLSSHTTQGKAMRELMSTFEDLKKAFDKEERDMVLDLPSPLSNMNLDTRVNGGEIKIPHAVMTGFFHECAAEIIKDIEGQISQIDGLNKRTKNVFLVGGFGESKFLQKEIEFSLRHRGGIKLRVPETSWTAVVQGAVLCGIEKDTMSNLSKAMPCPKHFGITLDEPFSSADHPGQERSTHPLTNSELAVGQLIWLLNKGDLILSDNLEPITQKINMPFLPTENRMRRMIIYSYDDEDNRPTSLRSAMDELRVSHELEYNLADIPQAKVRKQRGRNGTFFNAALTLTLTLSHNGLQSSLKCEEMELNTGGEFW